MIVAKFRKSVSKPFQSGTINPATDVTWDIWFDCIGVLVALVVIAIAVFVPLASDISDFSDDTDFLPMAIARNLTPESLVSKTRESSQTPAQNEKNPLLAGFRDELGSDRSRLSVLTLCCLLRC